ncbi:MAG: formate/nitrite transporter family protein [Acetivibrionales bacterium]|jgi:formate/nitrite transporter
MEKAFLTPKEIAEATINAGVTKSKLPISKMFLLGILAGIFIAFGGFASQMISHSIESTGVAKFAGAAVFPVGLMLVVMAGAELFTGNNLMTLALYEKKITMQGLLKNWLVVYIGNFVGSIVFALIILGTGLLDTSGMKLGAAAVNAAYQKVTIGFGPAILRGILCNIAVVLAVWIATSAKDIVGKIWACWFPIMLFVLSGFEHSIANMYFVAIGVLAKGQYAEKVAELYNVSAGQLSSLDWGSMWSGNLIPVTIGNIIGGAIIVSFVYWFVYIKQAPAKINIESSSNVKNV